VHDRRAPPTTISLPSAPRELDVDVDVAASQLLQAAAPSPKGRPGGAPRQGSGGHVHAAAPAAMATVASLVMPSRQPTSPPAGPPAQGSGGKIHAAETQTPAGAARVVIMRGPAPPAGPPAQGTGGKFHAVSPAATAACVLMRGPAPPGPPAEGAGGRGGIIHAFAS